MIIDKKKRGPRDFRDLVTPSTTGFSRWRGGWCFCRDSENVRHNKVLSLQINK